MRNRYLYNYTGPMLMIVGLYSIQFSKGICRTGRVHVNFSVQEDL